MTWAECEQILKLVGNNVRRHRINLGLTQEELAKRTKIFSRTSITNIESGRQKMTILTLIAVSRALGVAPADLLQDYVEDVIEIQVAGQTMYVPTSVAESLIDSMYMVKTE